jgi:hypothetical protein
MADAPTQAAGWRRVLIPVTALAVAALLGFGTWTYLQESATSQSATEGGGQQQYGLVEGGSDPVPIADALDSAPEGTITVTGTVVDMGPTMGCWLVIDDGSGQVLVQTEPMTFVDQSVKGQTITATGRMTVLDGGMGFSGQRPAVLTTGLTVGG